MRARIAVLLALFPLVACGAREQESRPAAAGAPAAGLHLRVASYADDGEAIEVRYAVEPDLGVVLSRTSARIPRERIVPTRDLVLSDDEADGFLRLVERMRADPPRADEGARLLDAAEELARSVELELARVAWSPGGKHVAASASTGPLVLIDARERTGWVIDPESHDLATPLAFSPDGRSLAFSPLESGSIRVVDVARGEVVATLAAGSAWVETLCWSPDGRRIAALCRDNRRLSSDPVAALMAASGHPNYLNDLVLRVLDVAGPAGSQALLETGVSESRAAGSASLVWR